MGVVAFFNTPTRRHAHTPVQFDSMHIPFKPVISFWQVLALAVLFLTVGIWLASALSVLIMNCAHAWGGVTGAYLIEEGADKVMRRCLLGFSIAFLMIFLWRAGWRGWKDCGFTTTDPNWSWRAWHTGLLNGLILGILTMGVVGGITILAGIHRLYITISLTSMLIKVLALLLSALVVGFFEETVVRGILFRVLARIWRAWPAAVLSSLIFAVAHFIEPANESFVGTSFLSVTQAVFVSTFTMFWKTPSLALQFINLSLLGIVLCAFVIRTKTIWLSVGAHVAWVWMIKLHGAITMFYPPAPLVVWLGKRNDFMDSILATVMLTGLLAWTVMRSANCGRPLCRHGQLWHILPSEETLFANWLNFQAQAEASPSEAPRGLPRGIFAEPCDLSGEALAKTEASFLAKKGGRMLKAYEGCRVTAQAGMVLKEYRPLAGWRGWRFGLRPSRTRRAFLMGRRLADCGIPTPTPIAWTIERRFGLRRAEQGITTELEQAEPLTAWLQRQVSDPALRASVMHAYGQLTAGFHRNGFFNRDLKHENVLCAIADPRQLWVVDLDGVHWRGWITRRRAARDLRRVGLSLASAGGASEPDVAAFFKAYNATVPARLRRDQFPE
ncbi:MAG: CPBP family intramembrane metalloprotease [Verrucomicrobia bacterium]|nr:CPBP family intramembrane metalloprotease [Verrucomicrobiota bacterium]MBU1735280.1 CPBP family intramembrane metalloprotease [Verrucomicrobiota bacterium]MBU1857521.1 CPBP family intramembrane metalloprotease [Verrucomicrobiota bacterium]